MRGLASMGSASKWPKGRVRQGYTLARDEGRKAQNSAIMSTDTYDKETTEMYANIIDIVQLQYISSFEDHWCVVLLCWRWYNLFSRIAKPRADDYLKSINVKAAY